VRLSARLRRAALSPAGNVAGYKETHMRKYRKLAVRSDRGYITQPPEKFTSGYVRETSTGYQPVPDSEVVDTALTIVARRIVRGSVLSSPKAVKDFLVLRLADLQHEIFGVLLLTTRHELIDFVELFRGTLESASVHVREIAKLALSRNAAAVVLTHQHPSGICVRSQADEVITQRVKEALALLEVRCIDHVLVAGRDTFSFAEAGLI
jgi:DNA repair protein RadC